MNIKSTTTSFLIRRLKNLRLFRKFAKAFLWILSVASGLQTGANDSWILSIFFSACSHQITGIYLSMAKLKPRYVKQRKTNNLKKARNVRWMNWIQKKNPNILQIDKDSKMKSIRLDSVESLSRSSVKKHRASIGIRISRLWVECTNEINTNERKPNH